jgi:hypothetical protein
MKKEQNEKNKGSKYFISSHDDGMVPANIQNVIFFQGGDLKFFFLILFPWHLTSYFNAHSHEVNFMISLNLKSTTEENAFYFLLKHGT